ncbi:FkbM family methyltransferase [Actimicrobium sp. GrIS 1.19]|uniref:FkbM family methyltransferase n=1 Tax=Actimicrobium sp. GrIS 1.19 TaxID=3071708 RepID=UPI002DF7361D|nr:FkbM family methyltransferase [Actimicrobium sp. GrIS 1.19]
MEKHTHTQEESDQIKEYERRLAAGLHPAPLVERVDLGEIAGQDNVRRVAEIEKIDQLSRSEVRGKKFVFHTPTKRLLWHAFGQEHIESELLDFIDAIPDDDVYFDIGASNGIFSLYAAATAKKVVCFEPEVANFSLLNYNTYLNHAAHKHAVSNFNIAISDKMELGTVYVEKFEAGGHLKIVDNPVQRSDKSFAPDYKQAVLKYTLDDFLKLTGIASPNYVKIDVDGSEEQVLRGMSGVLKSPGLRKIFIELEETGERYSACEKILADAGFHIQSRKRVQNYFGLDNIVFSR